MTPAEPSGFDRWVSRAVWAAAVLGLLLAVVLTVLLLSARQQRAAEQSNIIDRQDAVEAIVQDVERLQECVIQLLLVPPPEREQLSDWEVRELCPPLVDVGPRGDPDRD